MSIGVGTTCVASGEQFMLFDGMLDLTELCSTRKELMSHAKAINTVKAYKFSWIVFERWCEDAGRQAFPASPDTVSLFVTWAISKRQPHYKLTNVKHICAAVKDRHLAQNLPSPITAIVRETLAGVARSTDQESGAKEAITPTQLRALVAILGDSPIGVRDCAILLVGFTSGWRSAELAALELRDVRLYETYVRFQLRRSKTDQEGKGRPVKIPRVPKSSLCPVAALEAWLKVRGPHAGPLFVPFHGDQATFKAHAIHPELVNDILKRALRAIGVDPTPYGAHSLRAGMVTAATENGADLISIRERTGHRSLETLAGYVRSPGGFGRDPLAGVL